MEYKHVMIWQKKNNIYLTVLVVNYGISNTIVVFHNDFSPSGEQPKQCILAHKKL